MELLVGLAVVLLYGAVLHWRGVRAAAAPLTALCCIILYFLLASTLNLLLPAGVLLYCSAPILAGILLFRERSAKQRDGLSFSRSAVALVQDTGVQLFLAASVLVVIVFAVRQPIFTGWDDYSYWGFAQKVTVTSNQLHSRAGSRLAGTSLGGAAAVLSYFFHFLSPEFADWRSLAALDIFMFSAIAALAAPLQKKERHLAPAMLLFGFLISFLLTNYTHYAHSAWQSDRYLEMTLDLPLGMVSAAPIAVYLAQLREKRRCWWAVFSVLLCLPLLKDTGMAMAMVVAVIIAAMELFTGPDGEGLRKKGKTLGILVRGAAMVLSPPLVYAGWNSFWRTWVVRFMPEVAARWTKAGTEGSSVMAVVWQILDPARRTPKFNAVFLAMADAFLHREICYLGTPVVITLLLTAAGILVGLLAQNKKDRVRLWGGTVLLGLGHLAWQLFLALCYIALFSEEEGAGLASYNRYIYSYFVMWTFALIAMACDVPFTRPKWKTAGTLLACCCGLVLFGHEITVGHTFLSFQNTSVMTQLRESREQYHAIAGMLPGEHNRIFLIAQRDIGFSWFVSGYEMWPKGEIASEYAAMSTRPQEELELEEDSILSVSLEEWEAILRENYDFVYVMIVDNAFQEEYGSLFDTEEIYGNALYRVCTSDGRLRLVLWEGGDAA